MYFKYIYQHLSRVRFILKNKCIKCSDSILQIEYKNYFIRANKYTLFNTFYLKKIFNTYNLKKW